MTKNPPWTVTGLMLEADYEITFNRMKYMKLKTDAKNDLFESNFRFFPQSNPKF